MKQRSPTSVLVIIINGLVLLLFLSINKSHAHVGIITALDNSFEKLREKLQITEQEVVGGRTFVQGHLQSKQVTLVQSPMGKVNYTITTQLLISHFKVGSIISLSPAGALNKDLSVGDAVVATEVYQHDFGTWKPYGFIWGEVPVFQPNATEDYNTFPIHSLTKLPPEITEKNKLSHGVIVSGDQFIADPGKRQWLIKKFNADAVDMGAAAIVQSCYCSNIPVIIVRVITDYAGENARVTFSTSVSAYQTNIDLPNLIIHLCALLNQS